MRKHVKPADAGASIPDPVRQTDLPPEGRVVDWSVHWARLAAREDIVVFDVADEPEVETKAEEPPADAAPADGAQQIVPAEKAAWQAPAQVPAEGTTASVPFMITAANRKRLKALGKTDDEIANMKPEEAQAILAAADTQTA